EVDLSVFTGSLAGGLEGIVGADQRVVEEGDHDIHVGIKGEQILRVRITAIRVDAIDFANDLRVGQQLVQSGLQALAALLGPGSGVKLKDADLGLAAEVLVDVVRGHLADGVADVIADAVVGEVADVHVDVPCAGDDTGVIGALNGIAGRFRV